MNSIFDARRLAIIYLFIPLSIFIWNWFDLYLSIPIISLAAYCAYSFSWRDSLTPLSPKTLVILCGMIGIWVFLSGIGGYTFQNWDHLFRNTVLRDLVSNEWPVVYQDVGESPVMLCYYLTYWLPAALVGKMTSLNIAHLALYLWSVAGMLLIVRIACNIQSRHAIFLVFYLMFCSGADIIPYAATHASNIRPWSHMEWYFPWQYSSMTTCLFWVFNQAIPAWICTLLVADRQTTFGQKIFISGIMYSYAPFPYIGIVMYVALDYFIDVCDRYNRKNDLKRWLMEELLNLSKRKECIYIVCGLLLTLLLSIYFGCTGCSKSMYIFHCFSTWRYAVFCIIEFMIPAAIMLAYRYQVRRVAICVIILLILPLVQIVSFHDFVMRVSIPALFLLFLTFFSFLVERCTNRKLMTVCVLYIIVCATVPCSEMLRCIGKSYLGECTPQYLTSLPKSPHCAANFSSWNFQETSYYRYFMKRAKSKEKR